MQNDIVFVSRYFNIYNITWNNHHINSFYKEYGNILKKLQEKSKKSSDFIPLNVIDKFTLHRTLDWVYYRLQSV